MDPGPLRDALTVAGGLFTGVLSGAFGVGGAVVSTPIIRALGASAIVSVGTTLPPALPSAISGSVRYLNAGLVVGAAALWTVPPGIVTSILGSLLTDHVPGHGHLLQLITAGLLGFTAWRTGAGPHTGDDVHVASAEIGRTARERTLLVVIGALAGLLSGLLGVGGGFVMVPAFTAYTRMSIKQAIATSLVCVGLFAIPGTITHGLLGEIDWRFALGLTIGVIPGARIGSGLAIRAAERRLRQMVALFLGVIAVVYAVGEALALR